MSVILMIVLVNLILYFPSIYCGLIIDDIQWYEDLKLNPQWSRPTKNRWKEFIKNSLYGGGICGLNNIAWDHFLTTCLHTLACVLIYLSLGHDNISLGAALLYSCNPANNQTSIWLNGRRYLINVILFLIMMLNPWCALFYFLTLIFQVTAIFAPLLMWYAPWAIILIAPALYLRWDVISNNIKSRLQAIHSEDLRLFKSTRLIVITKAYGWYFFKMLIPGRILMVPHQPLTMWGVTEEGNKNAYSFNLDFYRGLCAFIITIFVFCILPDNYKSWCAFLFLATLQWCCIIPVVQNTADRYISLPNVFMMFFVSYYIHSETIILMICAAYTTNLMGVFKMYENIENYYKYHLLYDPYNVNVRNNYAGALINNKQLLKASALIEEGLRLTPNDFGLLTFAGIVEIEQGHTDNGVAFLNKADENKYIGQK